jgi:hypothetical protein
MKSKPILATLIALTALTHAFAAEKPETELLTLYSESHSDPESPCRIGTKMLIDHASATAAFSDFILGPCKISVPPNSRIYRLNAPDTSAAGVFHTGLRTNQRGTHSLSIADYRQATAPDPLLVLVQVTETDPSGAPRSYSGESRGSSP